MKNTDDQNPSKCDMKASPATSMTLKDVMKLLQADQLPGDDRQLRHLVSWTEKAVKQQGEDYVRRHRQLYLESWDYILELGL